MEESVKKADDRDVRPQRSVTIPNDQVGPSTAIAVTLTRSLGSMTAVYTTAIFVGTWILLVQLGPLGKVDKYPYNFLLFLDNAFQLTLCMVILVGQRVLSRDGDRRSVQTYESVEQTFAYFADLHAELDRQGKALGRGVSLLESSHDPRIEQHRVNPPPLALDHVTGFNDRIAAWLMNRLSGMAAVYVTMAIEVAWFGGYYAGWQHFDESPFPVMTLLSTVIQLILMLVIMVGQDVISQTGDDRATQTSLDSRATLHEMAWLKARIAAQTPLIESGADYIFNQATDALAKVLYDRERRAARSKSAPDIESCRERARRFGDRLAAIGCIMVPAFGAVSEFSFLDDEIAQLLRLDNGRAASEQEIRAIPGMLESIGFQVQRVDPQEYKGIGRGDFTVGEWRILVEAPLAAGWLIALAEGLLDPEEDEAVQEKIREATKHPVRLIRHVAEDIVFRGRPQYGTKYEEYKGQALTEIRYAAEVVKSKGQAELLQYRQFLEEITAAAADANREGGLFGGWLARYRTHNEIAAMEAVRAEIDRVAADD
jgi:uncharacterized membrane protein